MWFPNNPTGVKHPGSVLLYDRWLPNGHDDAYWLPCWMLDQSIPFLQTAWHEHCRLAACEVSQCPASLTL